MNISTNARDALRAVANESAKNKIHRCRKIIVDLEKNPEEASHRVCGDLRKVLTSVKNSPESFAEEVAAAGDLLLRVKAIDPRRQKRIADETEENVIDDTPTIVAGVTASEVPKAKLPEERPIFVTFETVQRAVGTVDVELWNQFRTTANKRAGLLREGDRNLSAEQRKIILEALLGDLPLTFVNAKALLTGIYLAKLNERQQPIVGNDFVPLVCVVRGFVEQNRPAPTEINCRGTIQ
jgi:hypothetical protein